MDQEQVDVILLQVLQHAPGRLLHLSSIMVTVVQLHDVLSIGMKQHAIFLATSQRKFLMVHMGTHIFLLVLLVSGDHDMVTGLRHSAPY